MHMPRGRRRLLLLAAVVALSAIACAESGSPAPATPTGATAATAAVSPSAPPPTPSQVDVDDEGQSGDTGAAASDAPSAEPASAAPDQPTAARLPGEPDPALTPGALNPDVTQATIDSTICVAGWTATVRPPSSYTTALKIEQIAQYSYADTSTSAYEEDHLIPLELGGAPDDPRNLWPEPYSIALPDGTQVGAHVKDQVENALKAEVCAGTLTLAAAQARIGDHWVHSLLGLPLGGASASSAGPGQTAAPAPSAGATGGLFVRFSSLPSPALRGTTASMSARTKPDATCSARVVWPSGTVSKAAGLQTRPTAGDDGIVAWTWNVAATTKPGTAKASVTCTLGSSVTATATFVLK